MTPKRRKPQPESLVEAYKRVRKPVPPPEKVIPDRRDKIVERAERRARRDDPDEP
jgi:hypothetical protein